jgi:hypothetical protein
MSDMANATVPKIFLIMKLLRLFPPPEAKRAGPTPQATPRAFGGSSSTIGTASEMLCAPNKCEVSA